MKLRPGAENGPAGAIVVTTASRPLRRQLRPLAWLALEEVALDAVAEKGRLVARTSARQVAELLGVEPGTAAGALRTLRRHGLLVLEREKGPTGRFGLSVYVLGRVDGLSVRSPRVAEPSAVLPLVVEPEAAEPEMALSHAGLRRVELSRLEISDKAVTDVAEAGTAAVGTARPRQDRLPVSERRPAEAVAAQHARAEGTGTSSVPPPQCPGQEALDLGLASS
jgi:DNA-binding transcriptional ArsR family regulator